MYLSVRKTKILTYTWTCPLHCFWRRRWCHTWERIQLVAEKTKNEISLESFPRKQIEKMRKQKMRTHSKVFRSWEEGRRPSSVGTAWCQVEVKLTTNNNLAVSGGAAERFSEKRKECKFSAERHWGGALREVLMQLGHACAQLPYCWWCPRIELLMLSNFCFWTNFWLKSWVFRQVTGGVLQPYLSFSKQWFENW